MIRFNKVTLALLFLGLITLNACEDLVPHDVPSLLDPKITAVRGHWHLGGLWNDFCRPAGLDRDAQAPVKQGHEPKDGGNHGRISDPLGLLRLIDCFATGHCMERGCGVHQFLKRRSLPLFRPQGKKPSKRVSASDQWALWRESKCLLEWLGNMVVETLFFMAGMDFDLWGVRGRPLWLALRCH